MCISALNYMFLWYLWYKFFYIYILGFFLCFSCKHILFVAIDCWWHECFCCTLPVFLFHRKTILNTFAHLPPQLRFLLVLYDLGRVYVLCDLETAKINMKRQHKCITHKSLVLNGLHEVNQNSTMILARVLAHCFPLIHSVSNFPFSNSPQKGPWK